MPEKFQIFKYKQNNQDYFSSVLPFKFINSNSRVLVYGKHPGGYQRDAMSKHFNAIKNYILKNSEFLFPTAIILAVDENDLKALLKEENNVTYLNLEDNPGKQLFRVVDGQHRLKGIEEASHENNILENLSLNVIVLINKPNRHSVEMEVFNFINSKSKRLKVDLIELAKFEFRILENNLPKNELNEHISIQVANLFNDKKENNIWFNGIKFGIHEEEKFGIIGVNAFRESIKTIVDIYLTTKEWDKSIIGDALLTFSKTSAQEVFNFLDFIWNKSVYNKWSSCFKKNLEMDIDLDLHEYYYKNEYYIQKTLGTKAINYFIGDFITEVMKNTNNLNQNSPLILPNEIINKELFQGKTIEKIGEAILECNVISEDWLIGKTFSGYSSESGFRKVSKMLAGKLPMNR